MKGCVGLVKLIRSATAVMSIYLVFGIATFGIIATWTQRAKVKDISQPTSLLRSGKTCNNIIPIEHLYK